ncbi:MAG: type III pantothenate kinase [Myxococcales bacterium]|nr:type III pantothenate kinase [Myxococcales bacterium]
MLLVIDVGNSNTVLGLYKGTQVVHTWRVSTLQRTTDEFGLMMLQLFAYEGVQVAEIRGVALCSVVPSSIYAIEKACRRYIKRTARVLGKGAHLGMPIRVDNPGELGPDRVVNCIAALHRFQPPFLIVDFGTATTFDAVDASGAYVGGAIAPGLQISADALFQRTSRLPRVEIMEPASPIGTNTVSAMQSGLFWGYVGLVDGLARRCKAQLGTGERVPCVATGGLANLVGRACKEIDDVDEHLTLAGLQIWFDRQSAEEGP